MNTKHINKRSISTIFIIAIMLIALIATGSLGTSASANAVAPIASQPPITTIGNNNQTAEESSDAPNTTTQSTDPFIPTTLYTPGSGDSEVVTWEEIGFAAYTPLTIDQVVPGMQICRVYIGNGGLMQDLVVHQVINFVPMTPGAVPSSGDSFRVLVEWTSDASAPTKAYLDLMFATDMGLTGDRQYEVRTFAGTCLAPISAEDVIVVLPPTL